MKPFAHALNSVKKHGGQINDYLAIHEFLDSPKSAHPDMRHRAILHNSMGPYIAARIFGDLITNSDGKLVSVRDVCEEHILEDMGFIPTLANYLDGMPMYDWLGGRSNRGTKKFIKFEKTD